jgi:hypothetical protein
MKSISKHRTIKKLAWSLSGAIAVILVIFGSMIAFFPPQSPPPLEAIARRYEPLFADACPHTQVLVVPGAGHITLSTGPSGISAIAKAIAPSLHAINWMFEKELGCDCHYCRMRSVAWASEVSTTRSRHPA